MFEIKTPVSHEARYPFAEYEKSFEWISSYEAKKVKVKGKEVPAVVLVFKNTFRAKLFLYWMQKISGADAYRAAVYLEDQVPEIYKDLK
jgi:hypothetical protein